MVSKVSNYKEGKLKYKSEQSMGNKYVKITFQGVKTKHRGPSTGDRNE